MKLICTVSFLLSPYQWTPGGWEDPLGAPDLDPWRGCVEEDWREFVEEDCSQAFDDVAF